MHITQGTFSFLPELSDDEICLQLEYCLRHGWSILVEHTDDPHPRNVYWQMWGAPMFDLPGASPALAEVASCRIAHPQHYVRVSAYDRSKGRQTTALSFIVNRPTSEPEFAIERQEHADRQIRYSLTVHPTDDAPGRP
ncbi:MAG TPA: ribulose bisphosphate carboxylase small subunit [Verrucomicrobiae bacterium]|nr:ribulose bisphosphate carboxylase small subunit [Verrucomicrobiae bacterium]